jgi:hypothetical protein
MMNNHLQRRRFRLSTFDFRLPTRRSRRGAALIIALALVLGLLLLVAATQRLVVSQLASTRTERDYDRALMMAEAGCNAYLNWLANGPGVDAGGNAIPNGSLIPPAASWNNTSWGVNGEPSLDQVKRWMMDGTISTTSSPPVIYYPPGQKNTAYVVAQTSTASGTVGLTAYGWSNGAVRRVKIPDGGALAFSVFDWAAAYGLDPNTGSGSGDTGPAWKFNGDASIVGASGGEGLIQIAQGKTVNWYNGPIILAAAGNTLNPYPSFNPNYGTGTPLQSYPVGSLAYPNGLPTGCPTLGNIASPWIRRLTRSLNLETADLAANMWANQLFNAGLATPAPGSPVIITPGVDYFRTNHNNNATGIRFLVKVTKSGAPHYGMIRELPNPYVIPTTSGNANLTWPTAQNVWIDAGMDSSTESPYGLRIYPGNYFFEQINQGQSDILYLRTYHNTDFPGGTSTASTQTVYSWDWSTPNPPNPNAAAGNFNPATERNIRFWIGNPSSGPQPSSTFNYQTFMEFPAYASRFRVYSASRGTITVKGTNSFPPPLFRVNMLAYNYGTNGFYGAVSIATSTYLFGSLIGWKVDVGGSCTIEKQAAEGNDVGDRLAYIVLAWTELP